MVLPIVHTLNMHVKCPGNIFTWPQRGKAKTKRDLACPGNYKSQITNYKKWRCITSLDEKFVCPFIRDKEGDRRSKLSFFLFLLKEIDKNDFLRYNVYV